MDLTVIIALLQAVAALLPEIEQIIPIAEGIIAGNKVTVAQAAEIWTVVAQLETLAAANAAKVESVTSTS